LIHEAKEKANQESNRMIEAARAEIQISKEAAIAELKNYLASTSLNIAEKVIKRNLSTDASQQQLVAELLSNTSNN
jgi:F-type H+-transporting ATPase subunit b